MPQPPADDDQPPPPSGWSAKLANPETRKSTLQELQRSYEDAVVAAGRRDSPEVRALVDRIVSPLTHAYVAYHAELDAKTRADLMRLLGELHDPRIAPAVEKAFRAFANQPRGDADQIDIKWAARATRELGLKDVSAALLAAFTKLRASTRLGGMVYRDVNDAMVALPHSSWTKPLIGMLKVPMRRPRDASDTTAIESYRDQLFWQVTAAQVLGELRAQSAVDPLIGVMLAPDKADLHATAVLALVKLGKTAVPRVTPLLERDDARATAALILGTIGRPEAEPALIAAARTANDVDRAIIARELAHLPASVESKKAFLAVLSRLPVSTSMPPGTNALTLLVEAAGQFYDPTLVTPLRDLVQRVHGNPEDVRAFREAVVVTLLKLARPDQMASVKATVDRFGTEQAKALFTQVTELYQRCGESPSCHVREMAAAENQRHARQFIAIKAGYMAVVFGDAKTRDEIVARLDAFENPAVRFVAALALDGLTPSGSKALAADIQAIVDRNRELGDPSKTASDAALRQVMYRLRVRAE